MGTPLRTLFILSTIFALLGCTEEKVDLQEELASQAEISIQLNDESSLSGILNGFCNETLCMDYGYPDLNSLSFSSYSKNTPIRFVVDSGPEISAVTANIKDSNYTIVQNNIPIEWSEENQSYSMTPSFGETGKVILTIKVKYSNDGYQTRLFFLDAK